MWHLVRVGQEAEIKAVMDELVAEIHVIQASCIVKSTLAVQINQIGLANDRVCRRLRLALIGASGFFGLIQNQFDAFNVLTLHCHVQGAQRVDVFVVEVGTVFDQVLKNLFVFAASQPSRQML